jgi:hypothetical protein
MIKGQIRFSFTDKILAKQIYDKFNLHYASLHKQKITLNCKTYEYNNVSELFTYVDYEIGSFIPTHIDSYVEMQKILDTEYIILTCLIYLNDDYDAGETYYYRGPLIESNKMLINKKKGNSVCMMGSKKILLSKFLYKAIT